MFSFFTQSAPRATRPVPMILGTDWWTDCDDAVAIRLLVRAHRQGAIRLMGIGINACMPLSVPSLDNFLRREGLPDLPLGLDSDATDFGGKPPYQEMLAALPGCRRKNSDVPDAVSLYRSLLAETSETVELVEIGYPQVLAKLLLSPPDAYSPLTGEELIAQKVGKLWMMAGKWDEPQGGKENNFARNRRASEAAALLCERFPVPITFLGWEVSNAILTGGSLPQNDILHRILCCHGSPDGRSSWDPMLALLAVIGDEERAGYRFVSGTAHVDADTGVNHFSPVLNGKHRYVIKIKKDDDYRFLIDSAIMPE